MNKILVANRSEIAVRIIRTAKRMGIFTVAVYSEADTESLHVKMADEAYCLGSAALADSYLNIPKIIAVALESRCDAIHPGYGFLAENPLFVEACEKAGLIFIGPSVKSMEIMGNKISAREFATGCGVPVTRGLTGPPDQLLKEAAGIGFPLLVKAAAGGGGKGMRIVRSAGELPGALESTSREAANYFADGTVYIEKYIENPRHIEFQLLGDHHGNVVHLFERECTIQRRYQKIIEEAPSPTLTPEVRQKMGEAATVIGKAIGYYSAGTIEFLVDKNLGFYFLEMNTRIQVEHPVTELTTGIDIVEQQILVASGERLRFSQQDLRQTGHAIECRIYAEDPADNFLPSPGEMSLYHEPAGKDIRVDSGLSGAGVIRSFFDPMIAKLIVSGSNRETARVRMREALEHYVIQGVKNNIAYLDAILRHEAFITNRLSTKYCDEHSGELLRGIEADKNTIPGLFPLAAAFLATAKRKNNDREGTVWEHLGYWRFRMAPKLSMDEKPFAFIIHRLDETFLSVEFEGKIHRLAYHRLPNGRLDLSLENLHHIAWVSMPYPGKVLVTIGGHEFMVTRNDLLPLQPAFNTAETLSGNDKGNIVSPMPGKVIQIAVNEGEKVTKGSLLVIVEAMKMENSILSPSDAIIDRVNVSVGDLVDGSMPLVRLSAE